MGAAHQLALGPSRSYPSLDSSSRRSAGQVALGLPQDSPAPARSSCRPAHQVLLLPCHSLHSSSGGSKQLLEQPRATADPLTPHGCSAGTKTRTASFLRPVWHRELSPGQHHRTVSLEEREFGGEGEEERELFLAVATKVETNPRRCYINATATTARQNY